MTTFHAQQHARVPFTNEIALIEGKMVLCFCVPADDVDLLVPVDTKMAVRRKLDGVVVSSAPTRRHP